MRSKSLGAANLALVSLYLAPLWGADALRALLSPFNGLNDRVHVATLTYAREFFGFGFQGLIGTVNVLAGLKLVIAAGLIAYLIEFVRAMVVGRELDRATLNVGLVLSLGATAIWAVPALALGDAGLTRIYASQLLLIAGALIVILVERHI